MEIGCDLQTVRLKAINYRNGIVKFSIPQHWREEYDASGGASFYEDSPNSGTLRVHSLSFESDAPLAASSAYEALSGMGQPGKTERLHANLAIARDERNVSEGGESVFMRSWHVAVPVLPRTMRIVVFTYTVSAARLSDLDVQRELKDLDSAVRHGDYSTEPGVSGDFPEVT